MPNETSVKMAMTIRYQLKPGYREQLMPELEKILALCAKEPEFVLACLHESADRPDELQLFEIWKGTKEDFARVQTPKAYRQAYLAKTKPMVASVHVEQNTVTAEWTGS